MKYFLDILAWIIVIIAATILAFWAISFLLIFIGVILSIWVVINIANQIHKWRKRD